MLLTNLDLLLVEQVSKLVEKRGFVFGFGCHQFVKLCFQSVDSRFELSVLFLCFARCGFASDHGIRRDGTPLEKLNGFILVMR